MQICIFLDTIEGIGLRQRSDLFIKYHTEYYYFYRFVFLYVEYSRVTTFLIVVQKSVQWSSVFNTRSASMLLGPGVKSAAKGLLDDALMLEVYVNEIKLRDTETVSQSVSAKRCVQRFTKLSPDAHNRSTKISTALKLGFLSKFLFLFSTSSLSSPCCWFIFNFQER